MCLLFLVFFCCYIKCSDRSHSKEKEFISVHCSSIVHRGGKIQATGAYSSGFVVGLSNFKFKSFRLCCCCFPYCASRRRCSGKEFHITIMLSLAVLKLELFTGLLSSLLLYGKNTIPLFDRYRVAVF